MEWTPLSHKFPTEGEIVLSRVEVNRLSTVEEEYELTRVQGGKLINTRGHDVTRSVKEYSPHSYNDQTIPGEPRF